MTDHVFGQKAVQTPTFFEGLVIRRYISKCELRSIALHKKERKKIMLSINSWMVTFLRHRQVVLTISEIGILW